MKKYGLPLLVVAIVAIMIGIFVVGNRAPATQENATLLGVKHADLGQKHIAVGDTHLAYNSNTPSSGPHYASPTPWGIKTIEVVDETLVHNAEHGGIVISYKPDLPVTDLEKLKKLAENLPKSNQFNEIKVVLVPRAANTAPVQLMAWTYTLDLPSPDSNTITKFYNDHLDKGPELVP